MYIISRFANFWNNHNILDLNYPHLKLPKNNDIIICDIGYKYLQDILIHQKIYLLVGMRDLITQKYFKLSKKNILGNIVYEDSGLINNFYRRLFKKNSQDKNLPLLLKKLLSNFSKDRQWLLTNGSYMNLPESIYNISSIHPSLLKNNHFKIGIYDFHKFNTGLGKSLEIFEKLVQSNNKYQLIFYGKHTNIYGKNVKLLNKLQKNIEVTDNINYFFQEIGIILFTNYLNIDIAVLKQSTCLGIKPIIIPSSYDNITEHINNSESWSNIISYKPEVYPNLGECVEKIISLSNDESIKMKTSKKTIDEIMLDTKKMVTELDKSIRLTIILICEDEWEKTNTCIGSIVSNIFETNYQIIIINNNSKDNTYVNLNEIRLLHNRLRVIHCNRKYDEKEILMLGLKHCHAPYLMFIHNNILVSEKWDKDLLTMMEANPNLFSAHPICNSYISIQHNGVQEYFQKIKELSNSFIKYYPNNNNNSLYNGLFRTEELSQINITDKQVISQKHNLISTKSVIYDRSSYHNERVVSYLELQKMEIDRKNLERAKEEEQKRQEEKRRLDEEQKRQEEKRRLEEEQKRQEEKQRLDEEKKRQEEQKRQEEKQRLKKDQRIQDRKKKESIEKIIESSHPIRIAVVCCYYNFTNNIYQYHNYINFRKSLLSFANIDLFTVELSLSNKYELTGFDNVDYIKVKDVLWNKERAINYLLQKVPDIYQLIGWMDCDIIINDKHFVDQIYDKLIINRYDIAHISKNASLLNISQDKRFLLQTRWIDKKNGFTGFGLFFRKNGIPHFYDKCILGGGDAMLLMGIGLINENALPCYNSPSKTTYLDKIRSLNLKTTYLDITIEHLYHGSYNNRQYNSRYDILKKIPNFNVDKHLLIENDFYHWNHINKSLKCQIREYILDYLYQKQIIHINILSKDERNILNWSDTKLLTFHYGDKHLETSELIVVKNYEIDEINKLIARNISGYILLLDYGVVGTPYQILQRIGKLVSNKITYSEKLENKIEYLDKNPILIKLIGLLVKQAIKIDLPYFIINLAKRTDRKNSMVSKFEKLGIDNYTIFKAIDHNSNLVSDTYKDYERQTKFKNDYLLTKTNTNYFIENPIITNIGILALIESTIELFQNINKNSNLDHVVILEDDVLFINDFHSKMTNISANISDYDILYLGVNCQFGRFYNEIHNSGGNIHRLSKSTKTYNNLFYGTYGYICSRAFRNFIIEKGINEFSKNNMSLDFGFWHFNFYSNLTYGIVTGDHFVLPILDDPDSLQGARNSDTMYRERWNNVDVNKYMNINSSSLNDLLKDKRIIIVGPSEHVDNGQLINSFDIIVRMNHGHRMTQKPDKYGSRTDILYHCVDQSESNGGKIDYDLYKVVVLAIPRLDKSDGGSITNILQYKSVNINNPKIQQINKQKYLDFENTLGCRPNCGTIAIWHLLQYPIKELYITGFTLFTTEFDKTYHDISVNEMTKKMDRYKTHDQVKIAKYYSKIMNDNRIKYDREFKTSVDKKLGNKKISKYAETEEKLFKQSELVEYDLNHYFSTNKKTKLKYKLKLFNEQILHINTINDEYTLNILNNKLIINNIQYDIIESSQFILKIEELNRDSLELFINNEFILNLARITNINLGKNKYYECSINIPISLNKVDIETLVNFDYIINRYLQYPYQINILHTDIDIKFLDNFILEHDKINYIYVENPYNFNLGYTRNLYKYLSLSDKIIFADTDIPLDKKYIDIMLKQTQYYDVIKPYDKNLIHLSKEEKYKYLIKPYIINKSPRSLFTITGGITLFKKSVLEECGGYEELNCYGREDRLLDVIIIHKGYRVKKNEFNLVHLWHEKLFLKGKENQQKWGILSKKSDEFNYKYYNCILDLKGETLNEFRLQNNCIHCNCNHNTKHIDKLIELKKRNSGNLDLFINNKYTDSIIMKKQLEIDTNDKILFIMGNGPSLSEIMNNEEYLNILRNNHTFGLNSAYRAYEKYNFYPTYFGCFDYVVNESHKESFENLVLQENGIKEFYFIGNREKKQNLYKEKVINNNRFQKFNFIPSNPNKCKGLSNSYDEFINFGCSGANATQIGLMKGYSKIILLGCDCNYINKIEEEQSLGINKQIKIVKEIKTNLNYWFDSYQAVGDKLNTPDAEIWHIPAWENVKKYCPQNTEIINCSEISKINFFDKLSFVKGLNKLYYENIIKEYTFIIKTFNRYDYLVRLLNSIKKYYNGVKIIVFDDSIKKENINNLFNYENLKIIDGYVNSGLSAGRNIMVENVETPFFLLFDDDFFLDDNCNLGISYEISKQGFDIIGGEVYDVGPSCKKNNQPRDFLGLLEKKESVLYLYKSKNKGHFNHYPLYDFVLNFFVGKTESFRNNKWNDDLKLGEHLDFFIRLDKSLKITYSNNFQIKHHQDAISNIEYNEYRNTVYKYLKIFKEKHMINDILTVTNNIEVKIKG